MKSRNNKFLIFYGVQNFQGYLDYPLNDPFSAFMRKVFQSLSIITYDETCVS